MKGQEGSQIHNFFEGLYGEIKDTLYKLENDETTIVEKIKRSIEVCRNARTRFLQFVESIGFASKEGEISFFKELKPKIESLLFYYNIILKIEIEKPFGNKKYEEIHYEKELQKTEQYFKDNNFLLQYYRSGSTYLDDKLFIRIDSDTTVMVPFYHSGIDKSFASLGDEPISQILTHEMLWEYLTKAIKNLNEETDKRQLNNNNKLKWTDSKTGLTELLYALYVKGCFNHGQAEIKDIAKLLENAFGIELGNYYRIFQELRIRKKDRTVFLNQLKQGVIEYMDETDLNYRHE